MTFEIDAKELADGLAAVAAAVAPRTTKPALAAVLLSVADGKAALTATDTEVTVTRLVSSSNDGDGRVLLDPKRLGQWLKELSGRVTIDDDGDTVKAKCGRTKTEWAKIDPAEFPESGEELTGTAVTLPYATLAGGLGKVAFAADKKEGARWATTGVRFDLSPAGLRLVATDTKRLAMVRLDAAGETAGAIVPLKAVDLIGKAADGGDVTVVLTGNAAEFRSADWTVRTRLVEGRFPPYQQIVPKKLDHAVNAAAGEFAQAVRRVLPGTDDMAKRVTFRFAGGECVMTARCQTAGAESVAPVTGFDGDVSVDMDPQFVLDGLKQLNKADAVTVRMTDETKPVLFECGPDFTVLVMPLGDRE